MESHKNVPNHQPVRVNPHDIPIFQWFSHGFPMIYGDLWSWWFKPLIPSDSRGNPHPAANFLKGIATINRRNQHRVSCLETNLAIVNHVESPSLVCKTMAPTGTPVFVRKMDAWLPPDNQIPIESLLDSIKSH